MSAPTEESQVATEESAAPERPSLERVLTIAPLTDVGRKRSRNEDAVAADAALGLAVVCDGMGGHQGGDVASAMGIHVIVEHLRGALGSTPAGGSDEVSGNSLESLEVKDAILGANRAIFQAAASQPQYADMGTTVVVALFHDNRVTIGHVGDSRLYRLRGGAFERLTADHSLVQEMIDKGLCDEEGGGGCAEFKNVVTRALGPEEAVEVSVQEREVLPDDLFLLCSDGLSDMVSEEEIRLTLSTFSANLQQAAEQLVGLANANGGRDNISVVLARASREFPANRTWAKRVIDWFI